MRFAFRQKWKDPRLAYSIALTYGTGHPYMQLESSNRIWYPDTFFMNARSAFIHDVTKNNLGIRVFPDGSIYMSQKYIFDCIPYRNIVGFSLIRKRLSNDDDILIMKMIMTMMYVDNGNDDDDDDNDELEYCLVFHTAAEIVYKWERSDQPVAISKDMNLPHFDIVALKTEEVNNVYKSGKFNSLEVHITFQRRLGFYIIQIYLPCVFLVFLSWMPFWMDPSETGDRLAVGITAVLTLVFLSGAMNNKMPKVSYMKAIDWYVIACFLAMVLSFVESMVVFRASVRHKKKESKDEEDWGVPLAKRVIETSNDAYDMKEMMSDETELTENGPVRDRRPRLMRMQSLTKIKLHGACKQNEG
ncbi:hypothetical protein QZH41_017244 [Actinostola sp. cb2023]|nr:hypothetical protein QZH41_017244 [Actinostola sp. cb2023]